MRAVGAALQAGGALEWVLVYWAGGVVLWAAALGLVHRRWRRVPAALWVVPLVPPLPLACWAAAYRASPASVEISLVSGRHLPSYAAQQMARAIQPVWLALLVVGVGAVAIALAAGRREAQPVHASARRLWPPVVLAVLLPLVIPVDRSLAWIGSALICGAAVASWRRPSGATASFAGILAVGLALVLHTRALLYGGLVLAELPADAAQVAAQPVGLALTATVLVSGVALPVAAAWPGWSPRAAMMGTLAGLSLSTAAAGAYRVMSSQARVLDLTPPEELARRALEVPEKAGGPLIGRIAGGCVIAWEPTGAWMGHTLGWLSNGHGAVPCPDLTRVAPDPFLAWVAAPPDVAAGALIGQPWLTALHELRLVQRLGSGAERWPDALASWRYTWVTLSIFPPPRGADGWGSRGPRARPGSILLKLDGVPVLVGPQGEAPLGSGTERAAQLREAIDRPRLHVVLLPGAETPLGDLVAICEQVHQLGVTGTGCALGLGEASAWEAWIRGS